LVKLSFFSRGISESFFLRKIFKNPKHKEEEKERKSHLHKKAREFLRKKLSVYARKEEA